MDKSNIYASLLGQSQPVLSDSEISTLQRGYQFLLIEGFMGDAFPGVSRRYFSEQMEFLGGHGIDHLRLEPDSGFGTQSLPENNVVPIRTAIEDLTTRNPGKRVVIVSHSKGGLDTLETLLSEMPGIAPKVGGWIALQAPFAGTPLADVATIGPLGGLFLGGLLDIVFDGDSDVLRNMRTDFRKDHLDQHSAAIDAICRAIPVLCYASHLRSGDDSLLTLQARHLERATGGVKNDGIVPEDGAILRVGGDPCCPFIRAPGVSHFHPVTEDRDDGEPGGGQNGRERQKLFAALLKIWLDS